MVICVAFKFLKILGGKLARNRKRVLQAKNVRNETISVAHLASSTVKPWDLIANLAVFKFMQSRYQSGKLIGTIR